MPGGGQASAKKVRRKDTGEIAFLKLLNRQDDTERRARFFREASAYDTFRHPNLPALVETNAHNHDQASPKLYIVIELIEGITLGEAIRAGRASLEESVNATVQLLRVVKHFHDHGWVHRDIKPDNIILRNGSLADPVLVDFGLGHKDTVTPCFETEACQEIGNRFLRLPELGADSSVKQDGRTDLAFVGGVLYYCLTGMIPAQLLDTNLRMPHQRASALELLRAATPSAAHALYGIFDKSFSHQLSGRFTTATEMTIQLNALLSAHRRGNTKEDKDSLESLSELANTSASAELARLKAIYDAGLSVIESVHEKVATVVQPDYVTYWSGYVNFSQGFRKTLGFNHFSTLNHRFAPTFHIAMVGDEIVVRMDDEVVHRTDADQPVFDDESFRRRVEDTYIVGMKSLMLSPIAGD